MGWCYNKWMIWYGNMTLHSKCTSMGARMAAARPSGILALSLFDRNVTASDPNIFFGDKNVIDDAFCKHSIRILFCKLLSSLSSLTGTVFKYCFPSCVFPLLGNSSKYVTDFDNLYSTFFSSLWNCQGLWQFAIVHYIFCYQLQMMP